jgi:hypothetical protein
MPEFTRCTVQLDTSTFCDEDALPGAPFSICHRHAGDIYAFVSDLVAEHAPRVHDENTANVASARARIAARPSVVYYVEVGDLIKIGTTVSLERRLRGYPPTARLLAVEPGGMAEEAQRLRQFNRALVAGREWFLPVQDLVDHIAEVRRAGYVAPSGASPRPEEPLPLTLAPDLIDSLISTTEAANLAGVSVAAISNWRERGYLTVTGERVHLTPACHDGRNRPLYKWIDVAKAERATRERARRTFAA